MLVMRTAENRAYPLDQLAGHEQPIGLDHLALGVNPLGLDGVQPRALLGQKKAAYDPHPVPALFDLAVVAQSISGRASGISAGPSDESGQQVSFEVTNDHDSLFTSAGQPAISSDGTLTYTPAADASGQATVSVKATDDGGTADGGVDTSDAQTFEITVNALNDEPRSWLWQAAAPRARA